MYTICGKLVDNETRCEHWHSPKDIIALKFKCCPEKYYPCFSCHLETNDKTHALMKYDVVENKDEKVVLCGHCKKELTFKQYQSKATSDALNCPFCAAAFNPKCKLHYGHYFDGLNESSSQCSVSASK